MPTNLDAATLRAALAEAWWRGRQSANARQGEWAGPELRERCEKDILDAVDALTDAAAPRPVAEQRCNGCGHQWTGPAPVVLCGECWRLAWPFIWGGVNPDARPCPHGDPSCPCQDGDPCHYEDTATTKAMPPPTMPPSPAEAREENEGILLRQLSDALTDGNASTWDQILHTAIALRTRAQTLTEERDELREAADRLAAPATCSCGRPEHEHVSLCPDMAVESPLSHDELELAALGTYTPRAEAPPETGHTAESGETILLKAAVEHLEAEVQRLTAERDAERAHSQAVAWKRVAAARAQVWAEAVLAVASQPQSVYWGEPWFNARQVLTALRTQQERQG